MKISIILSLLIVLTIKGFESARILAVFPFLGKSHHIFLRAVTDGLATRGHEVVIYTVFPSGKNITNIKEIQLNNRMDRLVDTFNFDMLRQFGTIPIFRVPGMLMFGIQIVDIGLDDPVLKDLIKSDEKFDLVLLETHFGQEAFVAFGHKFQAPVVSLNPFSTYYCIDEYIGNPFGTAYIPTVEVPYTDKMSFIERVHNTLRTIAYAVVNHLYYIPKQESIMRKYFKYPGSENLPTISDMLQNISLVIVNSQPAIDYPRPWVPNVIPVGGIHISPNRKPLPKDLQTFLDSAKQGFIYFSFGSVVPSEQMPEQMKQAFVKAFAKLPQKVLWKNSVDSIPGLPGNVKISKWLPQHDVLAHPNCLGFITHGGLMSQGELLYFGVPLIGVPFFADQYLNINRAVKRGFAIHLDQYNITEDSVVWAVNEVTTNVKYRENAKKYSIIYRDNNQPPKEKAAYWIEYVLRHKGAPHLRSEGRKLPYYKYLLLDVIAFITLTVALLVFTVYKLFSIICCKVFNRNSKTKRVTSVKKKK